MVVHNTVLTKPGEMADAMNKYFNEIGSILADKLPKAHSSFLNYVNPDETTFEIKEISVTEVKNENF